jgi:oligopeptide/dipeptide ABC transporter ATP-binding protein
VSEVLLEARGVSRHYRVGRHQSVRAVEDVSLTLTAGETVGLVGESGCGKSTLGRLLLGLEPLSAGEVAFDGTPLREVSGLPGEAQIVFQDPFASLNPRLTVAQALGEVLAVHRICPNAERDAHVADLLDRVGLAPDTAGRRAHELSGGQRQRVVIARALAVGPRLIVADEAVSALDVSIQAQILNLFSRLQDELGLTYLFISHDLSVIRHVSRRVLVMYLGRIVESGDTAALFARPRHPYTRGLLASVPTLDPPDPAAPRLLRGDVPDPMDPPAGCAFHPRCPLATDRCRTELPLLRELAGGGTAACHHTGDGVPGALLTE